MGVRLSLEPEELPVSQETRTGATLHVGNPGPDTCALRFEVTGPPAAWAWVAPGTLSVPAGGESSVRVMFRAPRAIDPPAGPLPFAVAVTPADRPAAPVMVAGTLLVAPFADVFATIDPPVSAGTRSARHTLALENRGNAPLRAHLEGAGTGDGLAVDIDPALVTADPGTTAIATVDVRPHRRRGRGRERTHPFQVVARPEGGAPVTVEASMRQSPAAPSWLPRAAAGVAGLVAVTVVAGTTVLSPSQEASVVEPARDACPAEGHLGSRDHGTEASLPASGYTFLLADDDGCLPVRFNPCQPVHYVLNDALAPAGGVDDVREAVNRLAQATGITFVEDEGTDEPLSAARSPYQPERYGERWAPILIGWSALGSGEGPDAAGDDIIVAGRGRPLPVDDVLVSGVLELNADAILDRQSATPLPGGFGEGITWGRVILHELGHVVGMGHANSPAQLMYPELAEHTSSTAEFGVGDLTGLRYLGADAGCLEPPPLPDDGG